MKIRDRLESFSDTKELVRALHDVCDRAKTEADKYYIKKAMVSLVGLYELCKESADYISTMNGVLSLKRIKEDKLIGTKEVCDFTGVCSYTLSRWIRNGFFPKPLKQGRFNQWRTSDIRVFLENKIPKNLWRKNETI